MAWTACSKLDMIRNPNLHNSIKVKLFQATIEKIIMYGHWHQRNKTKEHLKTEHNIDEYNPYKCRQCTFKVFNYAELSRHLSLHITELKVFWFKKESWIGLRSLILLIFFYNWNNWAVQWSFMFFKAIPPNKILC